MQPKLNIV